MSESRFVSVRVEGERGVASALRALRESGVPRECVEVLADLPLPPSVLGGHMRRTRLPLFTAAGLAIGLVTGIFFSIGTLFLYPLLVGGQVSRIAPPNLIIIYELTMFGIVVATALGFILETRGRGPRRPYFEGVSRGEAFVVVELPADLLASRVRASLEAHGGVFVESESAAGESIPAGADPAPADAAPGHGEDSAP